MKYFTFLLVIFLGLCIQIALNAQAASPDNAPSKKTARTMATGATVFGVFEGKCPCQELADLVKVKVSADCNKTKWSLTLYHDPLTLQPTTYMFEGSFYRHKPREGKWIIVKGTNVNDQAVVFQLDPDRPQLSFFFQKGDENVLFILDQDRKLMVGNEHFSFTLNRVRE